MHIRTSRANRLPRFSDGLRFRNNRSCVIIALLSTSEHSFKVSDFVLYSIGVTSEI